MAEQYKTKDRNGTVYYYKDPAKKILHREDGPAIEWGSGDKSWYVNGKRHRLDGPAVEYADGVKAWYVNGVFIFSVDRSGKLTERME